MRTMKVVIIALVAIGVFSASSGGPAAVFGQDLTRIGGFGHGAMFGVAVSGTDAFVGHGYYLQKLDITNPAAMVMTEELEMNGTPGVIELSGDHAFVMTYPGGLHVVDVGGPGPMVEVGAYSSDDIMRDFTITGNLALVVGDGGLMTLDITDPTDPDSLGALALNLPFDVVNTGPTAYVFDEDGLHVVDVTDPAAPAVLTSFAYLPKQFIALGALCIDGSRLFIAYDEGVRMLDITDPRNPVPQQIANTGFGGMAIAVEGDRVYVPNAAGISVFDFSTPGIAPWRGTFDFGREDHFAGAMTVVGSTLYYANTNYGLLALDLSDPSTITELGVYDVFGDFRLVDRQDDLVAVAGIPHIRLFDLSNPAAPDTFATLPLVTGEGDAQNLLLDGDYLYVVWDRLLKIYDVSNPAAPTEIYEYDSTDILEYLAPDPDQDRIVISAEHHYLYLDMSNPSSPSVTVQPPLAYWPNQIAVHNGHIFAFNWIRFWVVDMNTPDQTCGAMFLPDPFSEMDGFVVDEVNEILFLGLELGHVIAVDISDPCNPVELGRTSVPEELEDIAVRRGAQGEPGLLVLNKVDDELGSVVLLDFSDRTNFVETARYDDIFQTEGMARHNEEVIVTAGFLGFHVLEDETFVPVTLTQFGVERRADGVVLRWELGQPDSRSGFFVYREDEAGARVCLNASPLRGDRSFEFVDPLAPTRATTYWLEELDAAGGRHWLRSITVGPAGERAARPALHPNAPNPFSPRTRIEFDLPAAGPAHLAVYDISGALVRVLVDGPQPAGRRQVEWDGRDDRGRLASSGVYFTVLRAADEVIRRKAVLAR